MKLNDVKCLIVDTITNNLEYHGDSIIPEMFDNKLLGQSFGLKARDLVKLLFLLENRLNIKFPADNIVAGQFSTINQIANLAYNLMN